MQDTITIKFRAEGDENLLSAIKALDKATKSLVNSQAKMVMAQNKTNKSTKRLTLAQRKLQKGLLNTEHSSRILGGSLAVLRSKLLVAAFATALFQKTIIALVKAHAKQQQSELKVKNAIEATGGSARVTFGEIKRLTQELQNNGTVGDEVNMQVASLMLTYSKIGKETFPRAMRAVNDMATALANGVPTQEDMTSKTTMLAKALQEPTRGMTALRKVGFSLTVQQVEQVKQLEKLGKITEAQNIILEAAEGQYKSMAETIRKSAIGELNALSMAMGDAGENIGLVLSEAILPLVKALKAMAEAITPERVKAYGAVLTGVLIVAMGMYVKKLKLAVLWQTRLGWGALATAIGSTAAELLILSGVFDDSNDALETGKQKAVNYVQSLIGMKKAKLVEELESQKLALENTIDLTAYYATALDTATLSLEGMKSGGLSTREEISAQQSVVSRLNREWEAFVKSGAIEGASAATETFRGKTQDNIDAIKKYITILDSGWASMEDYNNAIEKANELYAKTPEKQRKVTEGLIVMVKHLIETNGESEELSDTLTMLESKLRGMATAPDWALKWSEELKQVDVAFGSISNTAQLYWDNQQTEWDAEMTAMKNSSSYKKASTEQQDAMETKLADKQRSAKQRAWKQQKAFRMAQVVMDTASSIMSIWAEVPKFDFGISATALSYFVGAMGAAQLGLIASQKIPAFAKGGEFVTNKPEMIMVGEAGREHVKITPIDRPPERALSGGSTINFYNPIMTEDFTRDQIIPQIEKATRLNLA